MGIFGHERWPISAGRASRLAFGGHRGCSISSYMRRRYWWLKVKNTAMNTVKSGTALHKDLDIENKHDTVRSLFLNICVLPLFLFFWLKWAGYLAEAGLNLLAQISGRISPFGV